MKIYQVGGAVRDKILGKTPHDRDYVVVGATPDEMLKLGFEEVGKGFPVFLHPLTREEYALARKEVKTGDKHTDFKFIFDKSVTLKEDLERRDFTCNAIAYDEEKGEFIDFSGGKDDIKNKILRHVNAEHFVEDPLRVLRLCRLSAQLDFEVDPATIDLCRTMVKQGMLKFLTAERVNGELRKAMQTPSFCRFIGVAREVGALEVVLPEINALWEIPERLEFHPEGNVGGHVLQALALAKNSSELVKFGILLHNVGKLLTPAEMLPSHKGHELRCQELVYRICHRLRMPNKFRDFAVMAAEQHMKFRHIPEMSPESLYDLAEKMTIGHVCYVNEYIKVCQADFKSTVSPNKEQEKADFVASVKKLKLACDVIETVRADEVPHFEELRKDKTFKKHLREFKIGVLHQRLKDSYAVQHFEKLREDEAFKEGLRFEERLREFKKGRDF